MTLEDIMWYSRKNKAQANIRLKVHNPWVIGSGNFLWHGWSESVSTQEMVQTSMSPIIRSWFQSQEI